MVGGSAKKKEWELQAVPKSEWTRSYSFPVAQKLGKDGYLCQEECRGDVPIPFPFVVVCAYGVKLRPIRLARKA